MPSNVPPFVLAPAVQLRVEGDRLVLSSPGDVELHQALGCEQLHIEAGGDVSLYLERIQGEVRSGGRLELAGALDAGLLHAREIVLSDQRVRCRAISAEERIIIGAAQLAVDIIIAPEILIDPQATGRVTVIESHNEREPTRIKGGFTLSEYDELFGDADEFLTRRGLERLSESASSAAPAPLAIEDLPPVADESDEVMVVRDPEEDVGDPISIGADELEPVDEEDDLYLQLDAAIGRIEACYAGQSPAPVARLRELIEARAYPDLEASIAEVWNGVLAHHRSEGLRPQHQVTHAFNIIHGLVQR